MGFKSVKSGLLKVCLILLLSSSVSVAHAQSGTDWELQSEKDGVKLYSATTPCAGKNVLLIRLENTNQEDKHVNFNIIVQSPGHNMPLRPQSFEIKGAENIQGSCDQQSELTADLRDITDFKLVVVMRVN